MKRIALLLVLVSLLALTGCGTANIPYGMSLDRHNFTSTPSLPLTFILRDTVEGKDLLRIDIPVNKTLVVDIDHPEFLPVTRTHTMPANKVYWEIVDAKALITGPLENERDLPGNNVMMKLEVRPKESVAVASTPKYTPTGSQVAPAPTAQAPVYHPVQPQPKAEPAPAPVEPQSAPTSSDSTPTGGKINIPVQQGPRHPRSAQVHSAGTDQDPRKAHRRRPGKSPRLILNVIPPVQPFSGRHEVPLLLPHFFQ